MTMLKRPNAIGAIPHQRQVPSQMPSHSPPNAISPSAVTERLGTCITAPGHDVTWWPIDEIASIPQDIGTSPSFSRPSGISKQEAIAHGMTQKPVIGTARALATTE